METVAQQVVLPGDVLAHVSAATEVRLGAGLTQLRDQVVATRAGRLQQRDDGSKLWVEAPQKRYVPCEGDLVLGTVTARQAESYTVELGSAFEASLLFEHFEGATKRNKPVWDVGDVVYARVVLANRDMDPELSCVNSRGKAAGFGGLTGGFVVRTSVGLARSLLAKDCVVLKALGKGVAFEIAVGMNGRVWVRAVDAKTVILVCTALLNSEFLSDAEVLALVAGLLARHK